MKLENLRLRLRLSAIESELLQLETPSSSSSNRRFSPRLKEERQRRLMKERITIQQSLHLIVYPILTIPVELTSEIFLHCLPVDPAQPNARLAPLLLGRICRVWRNIAYTDPKLWASLGLRIWGRKGLKLGVEDWLRRAGSVPLALSLVFPFSHCPFFKSFHCGFHPSSLLLSDNWGRLTSLRGENFAYTDCLALFVHAPRLIRCELVSIFGYLPPPPATHILLNDLEDLSLTTDGPSTCLLSSLLDSLAVPKLRALRLVCTFYLFPENPFLSFLQRFTVIQTFSVQSRGSPDYGFLTTILDAMPTLISFELRLLYSATIVFDILRLLNDSTTFLPRVQKLLFSITQSVTWEDSFTPILIDALSSRSEAKPGTTRLVDFRFLFNPVAQLDAQISGCVSKMKGKEMRIYVGSVAGMLL
ncbi:hypothetical protein DFH08DRAFT_903373 [Mycena albidolilacea]|uniref:F-box domain-containing protein n=1 Tax=Mycena albidolilacea TaxID=1033008 RepID=A0AAD6Z2Z1_9AGAR|nr:hypothetical protein DFH08DRAFT_903373 [Mycena albidolilacea]